MPICPGVYGAYQQLVEAPSTAPYRFPAFGAYNVIEETDAHVRNGLTYKSWACTATVEEWVDDCDSGEVEEKVPTDLDSEDNIIEACPHHLYTVLSCKTTTLDAMFAQARTAFDLGEKIATEIVVWNNVVATAGATVLNDTPDEAGAFSLVQAIGALESAIAACYPGRATIHGPRAAGAYLAEAHNLYREGGGIETGLGSKLALYAAGLNTGPDGDPAPEGYYWLYATSDVTLRRFPVDVFPNSVDHILLKVDGDQTNEPRVLVERTIVPSTECCSFAALVYLPQLLDTLLAGGPVEP